MITPVADFARFVGTNFGEQRARLANLSYDQYRTWSRFQYSMGAAA